MIPHSSIVTEKSKYEEPKKKIQTGCVGNCSIINYIFGKWQTHSRLTNVQICLVQLCKELSVNFIIIIKKKVFHRLKTCCSVWHIVKFPGFKLCAQLAAVPPTGASTTATHSTMALTETMLWSPRREP